MSASRSDFFFTLRRMHQLTTNALLLDTFPPSDPHNIGARILRHGLSVTAFAMLENHATSCFVDLVGKIGGSRVNYASFTDKLKRFLTIDAVTGLSNRISFLDSVDRQPFVDSQITLLASYTRSPAMYTALGFSPKGSNVSHEDIKEAFGAFGVQAPWEKLSAIATAIGSSRVSLSVDYRNLAKTRHSSAHDPTGNVPSADLQTNIEAAIVIGISVDVLASAIADAFLRARDATSLNTVVSGITHRFRFVDEQPNGTWLESSNGRPIKRYVNEADASAGALARARPGNVIVRNARQLPIALIG